MNRMKSKRDKTTCLSPFVWPLQFTPPVIRRHPLSFAGLTGESMVVIVMDSPIKSANDGV
jgi:hypothetical protein